MTHRIASWLLALAAFSGSAAAQQAGATCPPELQPFGAQCGWLELPGDHARPTEGPRVRVFHARVAARTPTPGAAPVLFLNGGPGLAGSQALAQGAMLFAGLNARHDVVFVDQRGTGHSTPSLACPFLPAADVLHGGIRPEQVRACLQPLAQAGYRTAWFDTAQSAQDLVALRGALGIAKWNVLGSSYGTILAQELLRRDGAGVQALVLDSPSIAGASMADTANVVGVAAAWERIFLDCAAAPACAAAAPAARDRFVSVAAGLRRQPLPAQWTDVTGKRHPGTLTPATLQTVMNQLAGSGRAAGIALAAYQYLYAVQAGAQQLNPAAIDALFMPPGTAQSTATTALGLNLSITCREVMPRLDLAALRQAARSFRPYVAADALMATYAAACPVWDAGRAEPSLYQPPATAVPTLLLTGSYDMPAPSYLAETVAARIPGARLLRFDGVGHGVFGTEACARQVVGDFFAAGRTDIATPCVPLGAGETLQVVFPFAAAR